ncbi:exodeoxyribonuclease VII small subunit [Brachybacterium huguangmaarense]
MSPAKKTPTSDDAANGAAHDAAISPTDGMVAPEESGTPAMPADIAELSYEAARDQLVDVVRRLESGQGGLEESIGLWERGELLATRCQQWLDGARVRLDEAVAARQGRDA